MPSIEINGKKCEVEPGSMIIEVADCFNIQIPRFCYHKKLSIAANCRMCLVEVERAPKPLPACATPVTEGMKIWTRSPKALHAQKSTMEFLLINHPLDCPICDQGGECELQDVAMGYGPDHSRYIESKRVVQDKDIGPLINTDLTRCIQCTRCVRFGAEIAGVKELGALGRGEHLEIGTYIEQSITSEVSGNIIDLCPVGALTSKPFQFKARGWELKQMASVAPHDGVGSNIFIHARNNQVMRVVPKENESLNEVWISDRDRFSYEGLYSQERLQYPKIKQGEKWQTVSWRQALQFILSHRLLPTKEEASTLGALISPNSTLEECYLFQKLVRSLGGLNIDHRLRQSDFKNQNEALLFPGLEIPVAEIEQQSTILLVGCDIHKEQPMIGLKLRKMSLNGGKILAINPIKSDFHFDVFINKVVGQGDLVLGLAKLVKAVLIEKGLQAEAEGLAGLKAIKPSEDDVLMAKLFIQSDKKLILLGALSVSHPHYSYLIELADYLVELTGAKIGILPLGANHAGAWLTGCIPHRLPGGKMASLGLHTKQMIENTLKHYLLFNVEPDVDLDYGNELVAALKKADSVIAITSFESEILREVADVLLPLAAFSETAGTLVNVEGQWQSFNAAVTPFGESRPGWRVLSEIAEIYQLKDFVYDNIETLRVEVKEAVASDFKPKKTNTLLKATLPLSPDNCIIRLAPVPLYATDGLVRRAKSLQQTRDAGSAVVRLNAALAKRFHLLSKEQVHIRVKDDALTLPYLIDETIPDNTVLIPTGLLATVSLGAPYNVVELEGVPE